MQEPKYSFVHGGIKNRQTGEVILADEPVMVFRAKDKHAAAAIRHYATLVEDDNHRAVVLARADEFEAFAAAHPDRMKEPDSPPPPR